MPLSNKVSQMASQLIGSEVLKIAGEIQSLKASGKKILNFTVGDFDPKFFPIPELLTEEIKQSFSKSETNYPPSSGMPELRSAVAEFYTREFKTQTLASEVLIAGGARPLIYTIFTALVDPGDTVLYPVPSWNNNHYCHLSKANGIAINCGAENSFLPTVAQLAPHFKKARLLCLNSPLNPTGTNFSKQSLVEICSLVIEENEARISRNEKPLYLMFDQIYWKLTHGAAQHFFPTALVPKIKPFVIYVDGISKYFCGTGLRVGWSILPESLMSPFSAILGHVGAWAPKPEQIATAKFLNSSANVNAFIDVTREKLLQRLSTMFEGIQELKKLGLPIDAIRPEGGIYLSLQLQSRQKNLTNEALRKLLLEKAGIAVVPFQAFGLPADSGWFRLSMGAVSKEDCIEALKNIRHFLLTELS